MSESRPRHGIIKFAGTVMDGLLDRLAWLDGKARETVIDLLEGEDGEDAPAPRETIRSPQTQAEELVRAWTELGALQETIGRLVGISPLTHEPQAEPAEGRSPVVRG
ncbi:MULTISPECIES: hypothetical protein [unclassified Streptomyces]|uniref:hypothetical protein n=1 Tax=unclassified Streptomyces TaxID=2593676 RepID=UPI003663EFEF